jgi:hypothetical protein
MVKQGELVVIPFHPPLPQLPQYQISVQAAANSWKTLRQTPIHVKPPYRLKAMLAKHIEAIRQIEAKGT